MPNTEEAGDRVGAEGGGGTASVATGVEPYSAAAGAGAGAGAGARLPGKGAYCRGGG